MSTKEELVKPHNSKKKNFILCIVSSIFLSLSFGSLLILGNFNVYIVSYIHNCPGQEYVNLQYGNLMVPILTFAMTCFSPISGSIEKKIGPKFTIILGEVVIAIFLTLFYFQRNIWFTYFICFGIGFGYSIIHFIPVKNSCLYYPKYKGIIATSILSFGTIFSSIFNLLGELVVNPDGQTTINDFYPEDISEKYKTLILYIGIITIVGTILCIIFFVQYKPNFEIKNENSENETDITSNNNNPDFLKDDNYYFGIKKIMKNYRIWLIASLGALAGFSCGYVLNTFRTFVSLTQKEKEDGQIIKYLGSFILICLCIFGPIFGYLTDKLGFRVIISTVTFLGILDSVGLAIFLDHAILYRIFMCTAGIIMSGLIASINPHVMGVFGIKYALELNGIVGVFLGVSNLIGAIASFIFGIFWPKGSEIIKPYRIVFIVASACNIIAFILQWFEPVEEFDFSDKDEIIEKKIDENYCKDDKLIRASNATSDSYY